MARRAFTLIEVLVATAMVSLLAAILLPSLVQARAQGRRALCLGNLHQLAFAATGYLDANRDYFWRYYVDLRVPRGRCWWFGFEPGGPGSGQDRPLDKTRAVMARFFRSADDGLQCPSFPYDDGRYFRKFAARSASYGYNVLLGTPNQSRPTRRRTQFLNRSAGVFAFADGVHFDYNPGFNEGHYIEYASDPTNPAAKTGYGHFRHGRRALVGFLDGHADAQPPRGPLFAADLPAGPAANLTSPAGGSAIYGY